MDMLRLYARTLKVVEPIAEANQHKAGKPWLNIMQSPACGEAFRLSLTSWAEL